MNLLTRRQLYESIVTVNPIWLERQKWPNISHYRHQVWPLGEDEFGFWVELKVGDPVYRGKDLLFRGTSGGVMLVPLCGEPWLAWFMAQGPFKLYVDIVDQVVHHDDGRITMVDLDLDVVRHHGGQIEMLDEDEFAEHQIRYRYPPKIISGALEASEMVMAAVLGNTPPFDGDAARDWASRVGLQLPG